MENHDKPALKPGSVRAQVDAIVRRELAASGRRPNANVIRDEIGSGSNATIQQQAEASEAAWRKENEAAQAFPGLPTAVAQLAAPMLATLWADAYRAAQAEFAPLLAERDQVLTTLRGRLAEMEELLLDRNEQLQQLSDDLSHRRELLAAREQEAAALREEQGRLHQLLQTERAAAAEARQDLEQQHAGELAAAAEAQQRAANQYSLLNDELLTERERHARAIEALQARQQKTEQTLRQDLDHARQLAAGRQNELTVLKTELQHVQDGKGKLQVQLQQHVDAAAAAQATQQQRDGELAALRQDNAGLIARLAQTEQLMTQLLERIPAGMTPPAP
ncbi:DNA-binding protein [Chromobacterium piscinae]|uniref:DNA-binding protein n=1 Tax=Chromobacterium piscinae TaxID=686831 RepID=UPI001E451A83|nr:DNA-binding protein [Chromobacterium piscinae]MCD5327857.1 DNA-binding protein [Chromobacterium piscinae]